MKYFVTKQIPNISTGVLISTIDGVEGLLYEEDS